MSKLRINSLWEPSFIGAHDKEGKSGIYSTVITEKILQYERMRGDRVGGVFSVVLFGLKGSEESKSRLINILKAGTRLIDHIGWYEDDIVCVLLTATDLEGARAFVEKISCKVQAMYQNGKKPIYSYEIFCYPEGKNKTKKDPASTIYGNNKLRINEALLSSFGKDMPYWKRLLDIFGAGIGLVLLSPLFFLIALYIKIVSKGPVLYKQIRVGYKGKDFTFLKFRTMTVNNNENSHSHHVTELVTKSDIPMKKLDDFDPRIIPGGKILRKACIDELPQLWNVIRGDMSLVGPRPCIPYEAKEYLRWHAQRFDIIPGITGLWQVSGKNKLTFHEMVSLDIAYARKLSLLLDLKIIFLTIPTILNMVFEGIAEKFNKEQQAYI